MKAKKVNSSFSTRKVIYIVGVYTAIVFAGILRALSLHALVRPNGFISGGVTGISLMLQHFSGINSGIYLICLNIPLIIVAWIFIGYKFAIKSAVVSGVTSISLIVLELIEKVQPLAQVFSNPILAAIAGGIGTGIASSIYIKNGASTGGVDIIATIIHRKRTDTNITWFIFMLDSVVVVLSMFVYPNGLEAMILSFILMFVSSTVCGTILEGFKSALKIEIITNHPQELAADIMAELKRGVTKLEATGMYKGDNHSMLMCVIRKRQITKLTHIVKKYPDSFAVISAASSVIGRFYTHGN